MQNMWDHGINQPLVINVIAHKFEIDQREEQVIEIMANFLPNQWTRLIQQNLVHAPIGQWVGSFEVEDPNTHPVTIFQSSQLLYPFNGE